MAEGVREIEIYASEGSSLPPVNANASSLYNGTANSVSNTIDEMPPTNEGECFISADEKMGTAHFDIPWSLVTHIKLFILGNVLVFSMQGCSNWKLFWRKSYNAENTETGNLLVSHDVACYAEKKEKPF